MIKKGNSKYISSLIDGINVHYTPEFINKHKADKYYHILEKELIYNDAKDSQVKLYGKTFDIPRKQVAYGDPGTFYRFSGNAVYARSWDDKNQITTIIKNIKHKVEIYTGQIFNFVLINRYEDGDQYINFHQDDERELGKDPTIVGVSFGAQREILFKPYFFIPQKVPKKISLELEHGSIFVMYAPTNDYWMHSIPKRAHVKTPRISLTFRYLHL
ncbi:alpha-ketoglutarate-dependent dioxygenase alkB-like [Fadolivirus algeromassiliense]|jgi:alkylated DNA repair dioxygenase AlkB|uniref:Alpha-ketoglutarate-dependent dioxygenase alkB-like n=1 Tax=Fadolivirus FV1/VV64 TaxID=3070911 RepID=A0A7D3QWR7_9VIRU|nr:alpha-ketoglutarate-dependent dioxygenase alkB-like [Fadolivirus algeromassiliense]QKF93760.1 alpha-ketoglutarate-dependent dioxygenase alkB-like [Fadolivirus FV1/VV64]